MLAYPLAVPNSKLGAWRDGHPPKPLAPRPFSSPMLQSCFGVFTKDRGSPGPGEVEEAGRRPKGRRSRERPRLRLAGTSRIKASCRNGCAAGRVGGRAWGDAQVDFGRLGSVRCLSVRTIWGQGTQRLYPPAQIISLGIPHAPPSSAKNTDSAPSRQCGLTNSAPSRECGLSGCTRHSFPTAPFRGPTLHPTPLHGVRGTLSPIPSPCCLRYPNPRGACEQRMGRNRSWLLGAPPAAGGK